MLSQAEEYRLNFSCVALLYCSNSIQRFQCSHVSFLQQGL